MLSAAVFRKDLGNGIAQFSSTTVQTFNGVPTTFTITGPA